MFFGLSPDPCDYPINHGMNYASSIIAERKRYWGKLFKSENVSLQNTK